MLQNTLSFVSIVVAVSVEILFLLLLTDRLIGEGLLLPEEHVFKPETLDIVTKSFQIMMRETDTMIPVCNVRRQNTMKKKKTIARLFCAALVSY